MQHLVWMSSLLGLAVCGPAQKPPPGTVVEDGVGRGLDRVFAERGLGFWGTVLVAQHGKVVFAKGNGFADRRKVPLGPQCVFDLGTASQRLTSLAALRLAAMQKLRRDDGVDRFWKEWPADKRAITVDHLLTHTSGLPPQIDWPPAARRDARAAVQAIGKAALVSVPGREQHWSELNAVLLALVLEQASGQRFDRLLAEQALRPAGMATAGVPGGRFETRLLTTRRTADDELGAPVNAGDWNLSHRGARGVLASVYDVHALLLQLAEGKLLDEDGTAAWRRTIDGGEAFAAARIELGGVRLERVVGTATGYGVRWVADLAARTWVVLLADDRQDLGAFEGALLEVLAADAAERAAPRTSPTPPVAAGSGGVGPGAAVTAADSERFVGTFLLPRGGGRFRVDRDGQGLRFVAEGLVASARFDVGRWPVPHEELLRRAEDRGLALVQRLCADDAAVDRDGFVDAEVGERARRQVRELGGQGIAVSLAGTRVGREQPTSWFVVESPRGRRTLRVEWAGARFAACDLDPAPPPFAAPLQVTGPDRAEVASPCGATLRLTVEGRGRQRTLVFEDGTPGAEGLVECAEADG